MYTESEILLTLSELRFADAYDIFIMTELPSEPPQKEQEIKEECNSDKNDSDKVKFQQRPNWGMLDKESPIEWQKRKAEQWKQYSGRLVIIENTHSRASTSIFAIDEFGLASKVAIAPKLLSDFNEKLQSLKKKAANQDGSITLSQYEFIFYISRYTGFHIEYGTRFAKGMSVKGVVRTLSCSIIASHNSSPLPPSSPYSVAGRQSPDSPRRGPMTIFNRFVDVETGIKNDDLYGGMGLLLDTGLEY